MTDMKPSNNVIAIVCIVGAVGLTVYIFAASRSDAGLRMASLVSSTSIAAALVTIASTMLIGKDAMHKKDVDDPAPGSKEEKENRE